MESFSFGVFMYFKVIAKRRKLYCLLVMFRCLLLCGLFATIFATSFHPSFDNLWEKYKEIFKKKYHVLEESARRIIWEKNVLKVQMHNLAADLKLYEFRLGVNHFTDRAPEEYNMLNGLRIRNSTISTLFLAPSNVKYPSHVDWREKGLVTEVKNQGVCGSCWAFSAIGSLEGQHMRKTGDLISLSEQNLVDCSFAEGNNGCNGGMIDYAFTYIKKNNGIDTEEFYPYEGKVNKCHFSPSDVGATITGWVDINSKDEKALMKAVATVGPISVAINSEAYGFMQYKSGIYDVEDCDPDELNHGVLVVGYGTENGKDYWIVKNSWGSSWGENGYIRMARNKPNLCGIAQMASYPLV